MPSSRKKIVNKKQSEKRNLRRNNKKKKRSLRKKSKKLTGGYNLDELVTRVVTELCPIEGSCNSKSESFKTQLKAIVGECIGTFQTANVVRSKKLLFESYLKLSYLFTEYNIVREEGLKAVQNIYQNLDKFEKGNNNDELSREEFEKNRSEGISDLSSFIEDLREVEQDKKDLPEYIKSKYSYYFNDLKPESLGHHTRQN